MFPLLLQEISPSGENGTAVTVGDYVRDVFLEQVLNWLVVISLFACTACFHTASVSFAKTPACLLCCTRICCTCFVQCCSAQVANGFA